jgi:thioredoxin-like negative regulator of GroEL
MPRRSWLKRHYRNQPTAVRTVLTNPRRNDHIPTIAARARAFPKSYAVNHSLVTLLHKAGRERQALIHWRRLTRAFPRAPNPYFQRALWAIEAQRYSEAATWLGQCLRRDRGYFRTTARFWRAECFLRAGKLDEAEAGFRGLPGGYQDYEMDGAQLRSKEQALADVRIRREYKA